MRIDRSAALLAAIALPFSSARADEGMWTFDAFPAAKMQADYGWAPDQAWLDKVRSAAVRLTGGCSASFVSAEGLILTNHHCVVDCLQNLSTAKNDLLYPDATFTLRISYGKVASWVERGQQVPTHTLFAGAFDRATGAQPFKLANAFVANKSRIDKDAVLDFVTTNDIIGGNSGSPVIDRNGTVIGAAFDGNIHSLGGNYGYDPVLNRTVVVSMAAVQEALEHIYPAPSLLTELKRQ